MSSPSQQCIVCKLWGPSDKPCQFAPPGADHAIKAESRAQALEKAYADMQRRRMGFRTVGGSGFGDPEATMTMVGPYYRGVVEIYAADPDPVVAVQKAIEKAGELSASHH